MTELSEAKMKNIKLLREFIHSMFGLDRYVTVNALSDVVGGPDPQGTPQPAAFESSYEAFRNTPPAAQVDVVHRLGNHTPNIIDELENELESLDENLTPYEEAVTRGMHILMSYTDTLRSWNLKYDQFPDTKKYAMMFMKELKEEMNLDWNLLGDESQLLLDYFSSVMSDRANAYWNSGTYNSPYSETKRLKNRIRGLISDLVGTSLQNNI